MKKYIATMIVIIVLLVALVYFIGVKTNPGGMFMIVPNGSAIQVQPGGQIQIEPAPVQQPDAPKHNPQDVPRDFDCQRRCG